MNYSKIINTKQQLKNTLKP